MESCCPAEEERLRLRGRTFEDPEQFRHADETTLSLPPPSKSETDKSPTALGGIVIAEPRESFSREEAKTVTDDVEASVISAGAATEQGTMETVSESHRTLKRVVDGENTADLGVLQCKSNTDEGGSDTIGQTSQRTEHGLEELGIDQNEVAKDEESEFRPAAAMSAKAVVRARRQWALRRARRSEGPNEANQLELGGGRAGISGQEVWTGEDHGTKKETIVVGDGRVVPLLVSQSVLNTTCLYG